MMFAILVGSHVGNIPAKLKSHWPKGLGGVCFEENYGHFSSFSPDSHFIQQSGTVLAVLIEVHIGNIPMKLE